MSSLKTTLLILFLILSQPVLATGDPVAGGKKALLCESCHGKGGNSTNPTFPKLAGQKASYIIRAVVEFQNGIRENPMMSGISIILKDPQNLEDIAAYFSSQPVMKGESTDSDLAKKGEALFTSSRCKYCHNQNSKHYASFITVVPTNGRSRNKRQSEGSPNYPPYFVAIAPIIGGQHKEYLIKAIGDIRNGRRPADIYDMMKKTVNEMSEIEIEAIAEYLSGL